MNQHDILKTAVADVSKGQTNMSHKGEIQTLTKLSMRHQVGPSEICHTITSLVHYNDAHVQLAEVIMQLHII